jgi:hypothetical protein
MIRAEQAEAIIQAAAEVATSWDSTFPPLPVALEGLHGEYVVEVDGKALAHLIEQLAAAGVPGWWEPRSTPGG